MNRRLATQQAKYVSFKRAHETLAVYLKTEQFLSAYVVAFSIVEDRLRTMYSIRRLCETGKEISDADYNKGLMKICSALQKAGDLTSEEVLVVSEQAKQRNRNLHAAMWRLDVVDMAAVQAAINLARQLETIKVRQKRKLNEVDNSR